MLYPELRLGGRVHSALPQGVAFRPATIADCESLAPRLRKEDAAEALAASGIPAEYALKFARLHADPMVVDISGTPEMIFGLKPIDAVEARPWMLGTSVAFTPKWRRTFLHASRIAVEEWQKRFPLLHNFIDARNTTHKRWLSWLGFHFIARHEHYGPFGLPFYEFVRIDHV
jgi:hypothetical protein